MMMVSEQQVLPKSQRPRKHSAISNALDLVGGFRRAHSMVLPSSSGLSSVNAGDSTYSSAIIGDDEEDHDMNQYGRSFSSSACCTTLLLATPEWVTSSEPVKNYLGDVLSESAPPTATSTSSTTPSKSSSPIANSSIGRSARAFIAKGTSQASPIRNRKRAGPTSPTGTKSLLKKKSRQQVHDDEAGSITNGEEEDANNPTQQQSAPMTSYVSFPSLCEEIDTADPL